MNLQQQPERAASTYLEQVIDNEEPLNRVVRLYEMALRQISLSRAHLAAGKLAAKGLAVGRAAQCLNLLQSSLNMDRGGEVAANLDRLYDYFLRRLSDAHRRNDDDALAELADHLDELGSAWRQAAEREKQPDESAAPGAAEAVAAE